MRLLSAGLLVALPAIAFAHATHGADIEDQIKARQAYFTLLGANIGPLGAMAKGEAEYDAEDAELHAGNLARMAAYDPFPHFPEASSNEDVPGKTRALPAIWENMDDFRAKRDDLVAAVEELQSAAGEGREALGPAVGKLGGTCKACHDDYRAKDF